MEDTYRTLENPAEGMFRDRNSRFLAFGFPVDHPEQAQEILIRIRKKYHDAKHHCYAYRIGINIESFRINDDGEPSGTAGKPIYNQILAHNLTNVIIIVVRYFGGTLLGTGGLINAYKSATTDMIDKASIVERYVEDTFRLVFSYDKMNAIMKLLKEENLVPGKPLCNAECSMMVPVRRSLSEHLLQKLSGIPGVLTETLQSDNLCH